MQTIIRGLVGLVGVMGMLIALQLLLHPEVISARFGLAPQGPVGVASLRADMFGFFGVVGGLAVAAAWRNDKALLLAPTLLIVAALVGRLINVALIGYRPELLSSMVLEANLIGLFSIARMVLGSGPSSGRT